MPCYAYAVIGYNFVCAVVIVCRYRHTFGTQTFKGSILRLCRLGGDCYSRQFNGANSYISQTIQNFIISCIIRSKRPAVVVIARRERLICIPRYDARSIAFACCYSDKRSIVQTIRSIYRVGGRYVCIDNGLCLGYGDGDIFGLGERVIARVFARERYICSDSFCRVACIGVCNAAAAENKAHIVAVHHACERAAGQSNCSCAVIVAVDCRNARYRKRLCDYRDLDRRCVVAVFVAFYISPIVVVVVDGDRNFYAVLALCYGGLIFGVCPLPFARKSYVANGIAVGYFIVAEVGEFGNYGLCLGYGEG